MLLIILISPSSSGYEISIYSAYPYIWYFIIVSIFIGQIILLRDSKDNKSKLWTYGYFIIILNSLILLLIPLIRGYAIFGRYDELVHLGGIIDICKTGNIGEIYYPLDHILSTNLYYLSSVSLFSIPSIIPIFFSILYMISVYLLAKELAANDKKLFVLILAFASVLYLGHETSTFAPSAQCIAFFPFILFIFFRSRNSQFKLEYRVLLILTIFAMIFFHPETSLFFALTLIVLELSFFVKNGWTINKRDNDKIKFTTSNILLIILITFFIWYFSFTGMQNNLSKVLNWFIYKSGRTDVSTYSGLLSTYNINLWDLLNVLIHTYGQLIILCLISLIFSFIILRYRKETKIKANYIFFAVSFLLFLLLSVIFFFNDLILGYARVLKYVMFFSSILVAIGFYLNVYRSSNTDIKIKNYFKYFALYGTLFLLICFSVFNFYWSPLIKKENQQTSYQEIDGMKWIFESRNQDLNIYQMGISVTRMYFTIYGSQSKHYNIGDLQETHEHFGYNNVSSLASYYNNSYLVIDNLARISYPSFYPEYKQYWKFTPNDFDRLENDSSVSKVYSNHDLNIYYLNS